MDSLGNTAARLRRAGLLLAVLLTTTLPAGCGDEGLPAGDGVSGRDATTVEAVDDPLKVPPDEELEDVGPLDDGAEDGKVPTVPAPAADEVVDPESVRITVADIASDIPEVRAIGYLEPHRGAQQQTLGAAEEWWGVADSLTGMRDQCVGRWPTQGITAGFTSLGTPHPSAELGETWCDLPNDAVLAWVRITRPPWHVADGPRIGQPAAAARTAAGRAQPGSPGPRTPAGAKVFVLADTVAAGTRPTRPLLTMEVSDGTVSAFEVLPAYQGD